MDLLTVVTTAVGVRRADAGVHTKDLEPLKADYDVSPLPSDATRVFVTNTLY